jgi:flagellar biosynthetic protein FliO
MSWLVLKMVLSLGAVLALMAALLWLVRRVLGGRRAGSDPAVRIDILGHRALGPKRAVRVLRVFDRVIVVGETDGGMQTLSEFDGAEALLAAQAPTADPQPTAAGAAPFTSALRDAVRGVLNARARLTGRSAA